MNNDEKARIILEALDQNGIAINWAFEAVYMDAIIKGLRKIEKEDKKRPADDIRED